MRIRLSAALLSAGSAAGAITEGTGSGAFGARGGLAGSESRPGLPAGTGFSFSAGCGVGVRPCIGGAEIGCALSAWREGPG